MRHYIVVTLGVVALWAAAASILAIFAGAKWRSTNRELSKVREALTSQERRNADLSARVDGLQRYQGIVDADAHARIVVSDAQQLAANIVAEAERNAADLRRQAEDAPQEVGKHACFLVTVHS